MNYDKTFERLLALEIQKVRKQKGIPQAKLQSDTGINIGRIESGAYSIEVKTLLRICAYLKVDCCEILKGISLNKKTHTCVVAD